MKHTKHKDRKSFKRWGASQVTVKPLTRNIRHTDSTGAVKYDQTIKLKP